MPTHRHGSESAFQFACPCGSDDGYDHCCGPIHRGAPAPTAEAVMRSRYSAFALGDADHLFRTWHPRTRPDRVAVDPDVVWTRLNVLAAGEDWVEFEAEYRADGRPGTLREHSRFEQRAGRWLYVGATP